MYSGKLNFCGSGFQFGLELLHFAYTQTGRLGNLLQCQQTHLQQTLCRLHLTLFSPFFSSNLDTFAEDFS